MDKGPVFKPVPKRFHPRGLKVLFEDHDILVVEKENGLLTVGNDREREKTAHFLLNEYVKRGVVRSRNRVFIVHRLDRDTSGILVFAKHEKAKEYLQENWSNFEKKYFAVVRGIPKEKAGEISSYLVENKAFRMYSVQDPTKGKLAKTGFEVLKESNGLALLDVNLYTGRKNQIRVHLADKGMPVVGDKVYGKDEKGIKRLALHAGTLKILHPRTKQEMVFETGLPFYFKQLLK